VMQSSRSEFTIGIILLFYWFNSKCNWEKEKEVCQFNESHLAWTLEFDNPIRSLSQNLQDLVQQETISAEDLDDMKSSVTTMLRRSDHLQQFVESYRNWPCCHLQKTNNELSKLIDNSCQIMNPLFKKGTHRSHKYYCLTADLILTHSRWSKYLINL
jgi:hypothetical protein